MDRDVPVTCKDHMKSERKGRGRPGITFAEVTEACDRLATQGRAIGPKNVRLELGGRGSYQTIGKHLRTLGHTGAQPQGK